MRAVLRRHATTLALVALSIGAGLWLALGEPARPTTVEREQRKDKLLPAFRRADLTEVSVERERGGFRLLRVPALAADGDAFELDRDGARLPGDPQAVDEWLTSLELAAVRRRVPEGSVDRAAMGLDAPTTRLTVSMGALSFRVAFGGKAPAPADGIYAEVEGQGVVVVAAALARSLSATSDDLRDRTLVPVASADVLRWTIASEGSRTELHRGTWAAKGGVALRVGADGPRVDGARQRALLEAMAQLRAAAFPASADTSATPRATLTISPREGAPVLLAIFGACPDDAELTLVERRSPDRLLACVAGEAVRPWLQAGRDLGDRHLFGATRDELVEVSVRRGSEKLDMARRGAGFFVRAPEEREVPEDAARGFVEALLSARGDLEVAPDAAFDGGEVVTFRLVSRPATRGDAERVEIVKLAPPHEGRRWALRQEDGVTLLVEDASVRGATSPELVLRDRGIVDVAPQQLREVLVDAKEVRQRVRREGEGVRLVEPAGRGLRADEPWSLALLERVSKLSAVRWVATEDGGSFGLDPPRISLTAIVEDRLGDATTERRVVIDLGAPTDDGPFARVSGRPGVFIAPAELEAAARRWLVDRGALAVAPKDVERLTIEGQPEGRDTPAKVSLVREGEALVVRGDDADGKASAARAARAREGLEELSALAVASVGEPAPEQGLDRPTLTLAVVLRGGDAFRIAVGATDAREGATVHYVRRSDVDATFVVGASAVRTLREALR